MSDQFIRRLREENDALREEVRQLREALCPDLLLPKAWGLTPFGSRLICIIRAAAPGVLRRDRGMIAMYGGTDNFPTTRAIDAQVRYIRRGLLLAGVPIIFNSVYGVGWQMPPESCAIFDAAVAAEQARWPALKSAA